MNTALNIKYTSSHEWIHITPMGEVWIGVMGISDHAQAALGDIVFLELPEVGEQFRQGQEIGVVESVKAASDIYAPLSGEVIEVNQSLIDHPEKVNQSAEEEGWMVKLKITDLSGWDALLDAAGYHQLQA
jgi:glycine cleavage system H protein